MSTLEIRTVVHVGAYQLNDEGFRHVTAVLRLEGVSIFGVPMKKANFYRAHDHLLIYEDGRAFWATKLMRDLGYKIDPIMSELVAAESNDQLALDMRRIFFYRRRIV